jgi:hypothetical protein
MAAFLLVSLVLAFSPPLGILAGDLFGSKEGISTPIEMRASRRNTRMGFAVCVVVRDEAPHLLEWCAYHFVQGAGKIFVMDDESSDDPKKALRRYIQTGRVEFLPFPATSSVIDVDHPSGYTRNNHGTIEGQVHALSECVNHIRQHEESAEWVALLDADEFILVSVACKDDAC